MLSASFLFALPGRTEPQAVPLEKGDKAPFTGQLLSTDLAIELGMGLDNCKQKKKLEVAHEKATCKVKLEHEKAMRVLETGNLNDKVKILQASLEESQKAAVRPWWDDPTLAATTGFMVGLVVSAAIVYGAVWAAGQLGMSFRQDP